MGKARAHGYVTVSGGFADVPAPRLTADLGPKADRRPVIERLVARRLLVPGEAFNTFVVRG